MTEDSKKTHYTIIRVPDCVTFECPYCNWEHEIDWKDFGEYFDGDVEYEKWTGVCFEPFTCDECGKIFRLEGVEID